MLQRDYFLRLIREFGEALALLLNKKDIDAQREEIRELYERYVGSYAFYHTAALSDVMDSFERYAPEERADRMEMLADLYYAESSMVVGPSRLMLEDKAYQLFDFVDCHSPTFSIQRERKLGDLRKKMNKAKK